MSAPEAGAPRPEGGEVTFDSSDSPIFIAEGPGDTTRRPRPPNVPRGWPGREWPPPPEPPPEKS